MMPIYYNFILPTILKEEYNIFKLNKLDHEQCMVMQGHNFPINMKICGDGNDKY